MSGGSCVRFCLWATFGCRETRAADVAGALETILECTPTTDEQLPKTIDEAVVLFATMWDMWEVLRSSVAKSEITDTFDIGITLKMKEAVSRVFTFAVQAGLTETNDTDGLCHRL